MDSFEKVDIRVGRIAGVDPFPEAKKPAYKLRIDFGPELGFKMSSAQLTVNYAPAELVGTLVVCLVGIAPRQIGAFTSEVLTLGVPDAHGEPVLVTPNDDVPLGGKLY